VFTKVPRPESRAAGVGLHWLPAHLWRLTKFWRGLDRGPWLDRAPHRDREIERFRRRFHPATRRPPRTFSKNDGTPDSDELFVVLDRLSTTGSSTVRTWLPPGLSREMVRKIMIDNPRATYPTRMTYMIHMPALPYSEWSYTCSRCILGLRRRRDSGSPSTPTVTLWNVPLYGHQPMPDHLSDPSRAGFQIISILSLTGC